MPQSELLLKISGLIRAANRCGHLEPEEVKEFDTCLRGLLMKANNTTNEDELTEIEKAFNENCKTWDAIHEARKGKLQLREVSIEELPPPLQQVVQNLHDLIHHKQEEVLHAHHEQEKKKGMLN